MKVAVDGGRRRDERFDHLVAIHEAGHALVGVEVGIAIRHLDLDAGETVQMEIPSTLTLSDIHARITLAMGTLAMGGRAAEEALLGSASTGATSDHGKAASEALCVLGSGLSGPMVGVMNVESALLDPAVRRRVDEMVANGLERARAIVRARIADLRHLAAVAQRERYLYGAEIAAVLGNPISEKNKPENLIPEPETDSPSFVCDND